MSKKIFFAVLAFGMTMTAGQVQASIVNGGFEAGLTGWSLLPATAPSNVNTPSNATGHSYTFQPTEGNQMLDLSSGFAWTALYQDFLAPVPSTVVFDWAFLPSDDLFSNSYAGVWLSDSSLSSLPTVLGSGNYNINSWATYSEDVKAGLNTLVFFANKNTPFGGSAQFLVDNIRVIPHPVPLKDAPYLLAASLGGFFWLATRARKEK